MPRHSKRWVVAGALLGGLLVVLISTSLAVWNYSPARMAVRWMLWSREYKSEVLARPSVPDGELKHIEWDGWGWAGQDTTVYLVYDPTISLATAASNRQSGKFVGIPCEVANVSRLEGQWYTVTFYTDTEWGRCE